MKIAYINGNKDIDVNGHDGKATHIRGVMENLSKKGHHIYYLTKNEKFKKTKSKNIFFFQTEKEVIDFLISKQIDFIYERYYLYSKEGKKAAKILKIPRILEFNYSYVYGGEKDQTITKEDKQKLFQEEKRNLTSANAIIAISKVLQDYLVKLGIGDSPICPVCVDPSRFNPNKFSREKVKKELGLANQIVVGFVGSFQDYHGLKTTIDSIKEIKKTKRKIKFLFVGGGRNLDGFKEEIKKNGLEEQVLFTEVLYGEELIKAISAFDIAFMTTPAYKEDEYFKEYHGFPAKLLEYMIMGKPTIIPDTSVFKTLIRNNVNGILIHPDEPTALANTILLLASSNKARESMGKKGRETVLKEYTWDKKGNLILDIAKDILEKRYSV